MLTTDSPLPRRRASTLSWIAWLVTFVVGAACAVVVVREVRRDMRAGEATLSLSLGSTTGWLAQPFRVWSDGSYNLFLSTVNFDRARVGSRFQGELHVIVRRPDGTAAFDRRLGPGAFDHVMPFNYGDSGIARLPIGAAWLGRWRLDARVLRPDPRFAGVASELKLWRDRIDPGMGGLINYVLIVPALLFLLLALVPAGLLASRGHRVPLLVSVIAAGAFVAFMVW